MTNASRRRFLHPQADLALREKMRFKVFLRIATPDRGCELWMSDKFIGSRFYRQGANKGREGKRRAFSNDQ